MHADINRDCGDAGISHFSGFGCAYEDAIQLPRRKAGNWGEGTIGQVYECAFNHQRVLGQERDKIGPAKENDSADQKGKGARKLGCQAHGFIETFAIFGPEGCACHGFGGMGKSIKHKRYHGDELHQDMIACEENDALRGCGITEETKTNRERHCADENIAIGDAELCQSRRIEQGGFRKRLFAQAAAPLDFRPSQP